MAEKPLAATLDRARYIAAQTARVAWYGSHYRLARRLSGPIHAKGDPTFQPKSQKPNPRAVRAAFLDLFAQDRANIEAGLYPAPADFSLSNLSSALANSRRFFEDLPRVDARRQKREATEVRRAHNELGGRYPEYYLQNFHFQSGGWLTEESARLYDTQVEILFGGAADAMRRIGLGLLAQALRGRDQRGVKLLDAACGNGRFLSQILEAFPRMPVLGLDLSPAYAQEAKARLAPWPQADVLVGRVESIPADDASFDALTCVYLFHELPPAVRRETAREFARVIKPGGLLLFADSVQAGDAPDLDRMVEYFPIGFHEPYYGSYQQEDLDALFAEAGFAPAARQTAFLTKAMLFRRA